MAAGGSSTRTILVRLRMEVQEYQRNAAAAEKATERMSTGFRKAGDDSTTAGRKLTDSVAKTRDSWDQAGRSLTAVGVASVAVLGLSAAAAVKWQSDWAGVTKTVDGTAAEMAALEAGLRSMTGVLPASHTEIAAVAEAAGQLGVKTKDMLGFTKVMIDLGETTNLTADEAATSLAQLMNVMQTAPGDVGRLGATVVALGNAGASTERDIVQMAQRIAGAAAIVGMSETDVLGLSNALASVGIEAEAGGSAVSRVISDIAKAVAKGGGDLKGWADVAGMTSERFAKSWQDKPVTALTAFISGLGRMKEAGGDVFGVLDELGQSDVRTSRALLTMAVSGDVLTESLSTSATAWEENTALADEAGKRYDTTAAKIDMARNGLVEAGIEIGDTMLPLLASLAESVAGVGQWFASLPDPLKSALTILTGVAGAAALVAGGFLTVVPRILETAAAFKTLSAAGSGLPGLLSKLGSVGSAAGGIAAGVTVALGAFQMLKAGAKGTEASVENATAAILGMKSGMGDIDALFKEAEPWGVIDGVDSLHDAIQRLVNTSGQERLTDFIGELTSFGTANGGAELEAVTDTFATMGEALASLVNSGAADKAATSFNAISAEWVAAGGSLTDLNALMPAYQTALTAAGNEEELVAEQTVALTGVFSTLTGTTQELTEEQIAWREELGELDAAFVDPINALKAFDDQANITVSGYLDELQKMVDAQTAWEGNMVLLSGRVSESTINELARMGAEGAPLVAELVNASDEELARLESLFAQRGTGATTAFADALTGSAAVIAAAAAQLGTGAATEIALKLASGTATVQEIMAQYKLKIESVAPTVGVKTGAAQTAFDDFLQQAAGHSITVYTHTDSNAGASQVTKRPVTFSSVFTRNNDSLFGLNRAGGGPVFGPGTTTSDSIPAMLSTSEHVWSAAEVAGVGGHAAVAALRAAALHGRLAPVTAMRFANGGSPSWSGTVSQAGGSRIGGVSVTMHNTITPTDPVGAATALTRRVGMALSEKAV